MRTTEEDAAAHADAATDLYCEMSKALSASMKNLAQTHGDVDACFVLEHALALLVLDVCETIYSDPSNIAETFCEKLRSAEEYRNAAGEDVH